MTFTSSFETKLARFREEQERKRSKPMSTSHRREVAKRLKQEIDATTDPQRIIELSNALAKFTPRPRQARRGPRKAGAVEAAQKKNGGISIMDTPEGARLSHVEPHGARVFNWVVLNIEKMRKKQQPKAEQDAFIEELIAGLSERDRAAYEAYNPESV